MKKKIKTFSIEAPGSHASNLFFSSLANIAINLQNKNILIFASPFTQLLVQNVFLANIFAALENI